MTYREMNDYAMAMKKNYPEIWYKYIVRRIGDSLVSMGPLKKRLQLSGRAVLFDIVCSGMDKMPEILNYKFLNADDRRRQSAVVVSLRAK